MKGAYIRNLEVQFENKLIRLIIVILCLQYIDALKGNECFQEFVT